LKMVVRIWVLVIGLTLAVSAQECSSDSVRLTNLVRNMTDHLAALSKADKTEMSAFRQHASSSQATLVEQLQTARTLLKDLTDDQQHTNVKIADEKAHIGLLRAQQVEVQTAADVATMECQRSEKLFRAREKEYTNTVSFIATLRSLIESQLHDDESMVLLQGIAASLPKMMPTSSQRTAELTQGFQNVLQHAITAGDDGDLSIAREKLTTLLDGLKKDTEIAQAEDTAKFEASNADCTGHMAQLRSRAVVITRKIQEDESLLHANTDREQRLESQLELVTADVNILSFAANNKNLVVSEVESNFGSRSEAIRSMQAQLDALLAQPHCCMCTAH